MFYPKYYCPTWWIGIARCLQSLHAAGPLLEAYADSLVTQGFRPDRSPIIAPLQAALVQLEVDEEEVGDDERTLSCQ